MTGAADNHSITWHDAIKQISNFLIAPSLETQHSHRRRDQSRAVSCRRQPGVSGANGGEDSGGDWAGVGGRIGIDETGWGLETLKSCIIHVSQIKLRRREVSDDQTVDSNY